MEMPDGKTLRYLELKKRHPGRKEALCSRNGSSQVALVIKNPPANAGDAKDSGSIPGSGRSPGEINGNPPQYSCLENPMDRGAWQATFHGVTESDTTEVT